MSEQEQRIRNLEAQIPIASGAAFAGAYQQALQSGQTLVQTIGPDLYQILPNGDQQFIKHLEQPTYVPPGTRIKIR